MVLTRYNHITV